VLLFGFSALLSAVTYLAASNQALNFLERREAVNLLVQFAVAIGVLVTLVVSADGISGERERGTLETMLVTPVPRPAIVGGKLVAALTLWFGAYAVSVPYVWLLSRELGILARALILSLVIGTLIAAGLASIGLLISSVSNSNKASLAVSFLLLLILFAPTQLPSGLPQGLFFDALLLLDPITSGLGYISGQLIGGQAWTEDLVSLLSPVLIIVLAGGALLVGAPRLVRLIAGRSAR
jgi:ABC-2 type transport system permease protein